MAGRFFEKDSKHYILKSQGQSIICQKQGIENFKEGTWIRVQLLSREDKVYQTGSCEILKAPLSFFKDSAFSYEKKGQDFAGLAVFF